jgi:hypothetical protein
LGNIANLHVESGRNPDIELNRPPRPAKAAGVDAFIASAGGGLPWVDILALRSAVFTDASTAWIPMWKSSSSGACRQTPNPQAFMFRSLGFNSAALLPIRDRPVCTKNQDWKRMTDHSAVARFTQWFSLPRGAIGAIRVRSCNQAFPGRVGE